MNLSVSSAFDGGNIRLAAVQGDRVDLEIVRDHLSDFYQWFYFRVNDLGISLVKTDLTINKIGMPLMQCFLNPTDSLEPGQFHFTRLIPELRYQSPSGFLSNYFKTYQIARHLYIICFWSNVSYQFNLGFINMPEGEMIEQIIEGKNVQFFF